MNRLDTQTRVQIVTALCEGMSVRATCRMVGVSKQTVLTFILNMGRVCLNFEDALIRGLHCKHIEADEVWGFVGCKDRNVKHSKGKFDRAGSAWTWFAIDRDSKLIISWLMGDRDQEHARAFMSDLAGRLCSRPQLSTDSLGAYAGAVGEAFFGLGVDYGQIHKQYRNPSDGERQYSPSVCVGCEKKSMRGNPNLREVGTSRVERANLTLRMSQRRWTRLTNAHSKSFRHMEAAFAIHAAFYNLCRKHMTIGTSPAVKAGLTDHIWTVAELVGLLESEETAVVGTSKNKRGTYRPRKSGCV